MDKMKSLFTTGEAADICNISQQTIIRCFDSGRLDGFRIPGSRFRRIPRENLIKFMKDNGIPLDNLNVEKNGKIKVLIVDDDAEIVELMVDVLSRDGRFETQTAGSGYEAGLKTEQFHPDVIILDYMLPDVNGNVVCATIKSNPEFESIRIIIVSGVANPEEVQDLLDSGATEFIKKPFNIADLVGRILQVVDKEYVVAVH
ncbi:MAG: response regulator [Planctomycetota bacterium]|jgi:excisionase family DNA binding protein